MWGLGRAALALVFGLAGAAKANDGVYFMSGNQLVPITETEISIARERLVLVSNGGFLDVTVAYEFDNPGPARLLTVGFEARRPDGDVILEPVAGGHPYMRAFTVTMNRRALDYDVALVAGNVYAAGGQVTGQDASEFDEWGPDLYVYHFEARFEPGRNTINHSYRFDFSGSVTTKHQFDYVLTAANRWGGQGIGGFELEIDMGPMVEFQIAPSFFDGFADWEILGAGRAYDAPAYYAQHRAEFGAGPAFALHDGRLRFTATAFRPEGELSLWVPGVASYGADFYETTAPPFDAARHGLPFNLVWNLPTKAADDFSARVLRNYLFARRGYVFNTPALQAYFEALPWYLPDPGYTADLAALDAEEQDWYRRLLAGLAQ